MTASTRALPVCRGCGVASTVTYEGADVVCVGCGHREATLEPPAPRHDGGRRMAHELEAGFRRDRRVR